MNLSAPDERGFVLIDALVAVAVLVIAGTVIYQGGIAMIGRSGADLDRTSALTQLNIEALLLQERGAIATRLFPTEDAIFRYRIDAVAKGDAPPDGGEFRWVRLTATSKSSSDDVVSLIVGYKT